MSKKVYLVGIFIFIIDQVSKMIVSASLELNQSIKVINNFFYIRYINNTGASWGILSDSRILLICLSIVALIIIVRYINTFEKTKVNTFGFGFLLGGVVGNLLDRTIFGYVKDFLDFHIFGYDFPIFNIADIFIVIGVIILIISIIRGEKNGTKSS